MSNDNDRLLALIATGDTLQAIHQLQAEAGDEATALNRALYTPMGEEDAERVRAADQQSREALRNAQGDDLDTALYTLGCLALAQDDIVEARLRFAEVLERNPGHVMARHNLAYAHELLAETDEARREYEAVLAQNGDCTLTRLNLAQLLMQEGDTGTALADMDALNSRNPANMGVLLYFARGLLQRGRPEDVERALELVEMTPDALDFLELQECRAYALLRLERLDEAEQAFGELLAADEHNTFAITGMLKVLAERADFASMRPYAERLAALLPGESVSSLLTELTEG